MDRLNRGSYWPHAKRVHRGFLHLAFLRFGEAVRVQYNPGRVTGEAITREGIDLVNLDLSCHE